MNIFITGVSHGFGKELAIHYLSSGHKVFGFSRSILDEKNETNKVLLDSDNFEYFKGSVNDDSDVNNAIEQAINLFGKIDVLINNAAYKIFKLPNEISNEEYKESIQTNLISPILLCQKLIPLFLKQNSGHIINISSNAGMASYKEGTAYCSSKAGLISYTMSIAKYLKGKNISVNVVSPPTFSTVDYRKNFPDINHGKLLQSEKVIKIINYIILNEKLITGKNFPIFRFKTFIKYVLTKNLEFIDYLFQPK
ncbi:MAG: SDR family NAD(P)-dependent oxidoreductase [Ignavibacteriae bacterium]|nr:SDR family NAD(P)-dependent oxidoreductase [Ignavibacteriota bacterium]